MVVRTPWSLVPRVPKLPLAPRENAADGDIVTTADAVTGATHDR
jgi:hypothetical protein